MKQVRKKSIVVIGGGTGTHTLLKGLKKYSDVINISAIVTMADSGGSTGRLRDEFGYLPVGDVRSALAALARETEEGDDILRQLFLYRFDKGEGLSGHTFGNLFLVALTDILGSEAKAIEAAGKVLATCGEVIPVTEDNVHLMARFSTGQILSNEHDIDIGTLVPGHARIEDMWLSQPAHISTDAIHALIHADLIVLGPGDFYTSILSNCVVGGVPELIQKSNAKLVYVANLMSRRGQTYGMTTKDYIGEIRAYTGCVPHSMVIHDGPIPVDLLRNYERDGEHRVLHTYDGADVKLIRGNFVGTEDIPLAKGDTLKRSLVRHDSHALARAIIGLL